MILLQGDFLHSRRRFLPHSGMLGNAETWNGNTTECHRIALPHPPVAPCKQILIQNAHRLRTAKVRFVPIEPVQRVGKGLMGYPTFVRPALLPVKNQEFDAVFAQASWRSSPDVPRCV